MEIGIGTGGQFSTQVPFASPVFLRSPAHSL
jgi:hypothetical protein